MSRRAWALYGFGASVVIGGVWAGMAIWDAFQEDWFTW